MRVALGIALLALLTSSCGGSGTISPTSLVTERPDRTEAQTFMSELYRTLERDTCGVRRVIATRSAVFDAETETQLADISRLASELCDAGVRRVATRSDVRGNPDIYGGERGWVVGDRSLYFFGPAEAGPITPIPLPAQAAAAAPRWLAVNNLGETPVTLASRDGARICVSGDGTPCDPVDQAVHIDAGARSTLYVESGERTVSLQVAEDAVDAGVLVWSGGQVELPVRIEGTLNDASQLDPYMYCSGYVADAPTLRLRVTSRNYPSAEIRVMAPGEDPVLAVVSPTGEVFCNDDSYGLEPAVWVSFAPGDWEIYAGSFSFGDAFGGTLVITP